MNDKQLDEVSKFLSYVLRHEPQAIGLQLDIEGWAEIDALMAGATESGRMLDRQTIQAVVDTNSKKRFAVSEDGLRIRAVQGHSTAVVQREYPQKKPPEFLYHGTATRFLDSILEQGLVAGARHHVHLSDSIESALLVGQRHGKPVVLEVEALRMHGRGFRFFQAENGVWLTDQVPTAFIHVSSSPASARSAL